MIAKIFKWFFELKGWKIVGEIPSGIRKCVIIGAPHTSNWDFIYGIGALECFQLKVQFLAKKELFHFPLRGMFESLGGVAVDRRAHKNMVDAMAEAFSMRDDLKIIIAPEGTRKRVEKWKSGFYHLALKANIPIIPGFLDYKLKKAGFGPPIFLTGDIQSDMAVIKSFYKDIVGGVPANFNAEAIQITV